MEIHRLHEMLTEAGIEHEWRNRTPPGYENTRRFKINWGWQVVIYDENGDRVISAIEGYGTYGYGDDTWPDYCRGNSDLIEIMGLLTPEEKELGDSVVGYLTAEDVFGRIKRYIDER